MKVKVRWDRDAVGMFLKQPEQGRFAGYVSTSAKSYATWEFDSKEDADEFIAAAKERGTFVEYDR